MSFGGDGSCDGGEVAVAVTFVGRRRGGDDARGAGRFVLL